MELELPAGGRDESRDALLGGEIDNRVISTGLTPPAPAVYQSSSFGGHPSNVVPLLHGRSYASVV